MIRHLPNLLSALRLAAAPFAAAAILSGHDTAAFAVFVFASASDALDGFIARRWGVTSGFGAWLDPAADKLLMLMCFVALYAVGATPGWLLVLVILRDVCIALVWLGASLFRLASKFEPLLIGKLSTLMQAGYVGLVLALLALEIDAPQVAMAAAALTGFFTVVSGVSYAFLFARGLFMGRGSA